MTIVVIRMILRSNSNDTSSDKSEECGSGYTSKIEGMLRDMELSKVALK